MSESPNRVRPANPLFAFSTRSTSPVQQSTKKQLDGGYISDESDADNTMDVDHPKRGPISSAQQQVHDSTKGSSAVAMDGRSEHASLKLRGEAECENQATGNASTRNESAPTVALDNNDEIITIRPAMAAKKGVARPTTKTSTNKASASRTSISKTPATSKRKTSATTPAEPTETPAKKKARKSADGKAESMAVPTTYEEMTEPDMMMWEERKKGKPWVEICARWKEMTGQNVATTTLPNRFTRIKEFIGDFSKEDDKLMIRCKRELEDTWSREIWALTAEQMVVKGGMKYSAGTIERRYRELMTEQEPEEEGDEDDAMDEGDGGVIV